MSYNFEEYPKTKRFKMGALLLCSYTIFCEHFLIRDPLFKPVVNASTSSMCVEKLNRLATTVRSLENYFTSLSALCFYG